MKKFLETKHCKRRILLRAVAKHRCDTYQVDVVPQEALLQPVVGEHVYIIGRRDDHVAKVITYMSYRLQSACFVSNEEMRHQREREIQDGQRCEL